MSATRFRRIARLERLAELYLEWKSGIEKEWQRILGGAAAHAAVLAFLIRYGNPRLGEPLEWAIQRCAEATAWKERCNEFNLTSLDGEEYTFPAHDRDFISGMGNSVRHFVMSSFPGLDERQKLDRVFAAAPPWLLWFTFADYTAALLGPWILRAKCYRALREPDLHVFAKVFEDCLKRSFEAQAFSWREIGGDDDVLDFLVGHFVDVDLTRQPAS